MNKLLESDIPTSQAERVSQLGTDMFADGLPIATCNVPVVESDGVAIPALGTQYVASYRKHPFEISITTDHVEGVGVVSLIPVQPQGAKPVLVGEPLYDPDRLDAREIQDSINGRAGFTALHGHFNIAPGADRSAFALFGEESGGAMRQLGYTTSEALTLLGAIRRAAANKLQKHRYDQAANRGLTS